MTQQVQLTSEGLKTLKDELGDLVNNRRPSAVERLANARSQGDLSENNDYTNAKEALEFLDGRIDELENVVKNASLIKTKSGKRDVVDLGTKVTVAVGAAKYVFNIVGEWEADPKEKKISHQSPLGKALIGGKKGDKIEVEAPAGKVVYTIVEIE